VGSYRRRLDIIADILSVVRQNAKKTQIMYQANLSYRLLTRYLNEIVKASLVRFDRENRFYMLTSKGRDFLEKYKKYSRSNKRVEKGLNDLHDKRKDLEELCS
jgi:predicted transcriptional regulator